MTGDVKRVLTVIGIIGVIIGPAFNLTHQELLDKYDSSVTSVFQAELVIDAWMGAFKESVLAVFIWLNRNTLNKTDP